MTDKNVRSALIVSLSLLVLGGLMTSLYAQHAAAPKAAPGGAGPGDDLANAVKVKKFIGTGKLTMIKTPVYQTNAQRSANPERDWMQISVQYDTAPDWINEIVFQYYVLAVRVEQGKQLFSFYKKTVKYIDVEKGRSHYSSVYLRPNTLKRYGEVAAAAVEVMLDGKVVATENSESGVLRMPEKWWTNPTVLENKDLTVRDGYLLSRDETPFDLINIDDNEVIK